MTNLSLTTKDELEKTVDRIEHAFQLQSIKQKKTK